MAPVAQWIEQPPPKGQVGRSIRLRGANDERVAAGAEPARRARKTLRDDPQLAIPIVGKYSAHVFEWRDKVSRRKRGRGQRGVPPLLVSFPAHQSGLMSCAARFASDYKALQDKRETCRQSGRASSV